MSLLALHLIWMGSIVATTVLLQFALNTAQQLRLARGDQTFGREDLGKRLSPLSKLVGSPVDIPPPGQQSLGRARSQNFPGPAEFARLRGLVSLHRGS